jgi:hypothetical protein
VSLLYLAAVCLVLAQILGIYALVTHKADLIFTACMIGLLILAGVLGGIGAYDQIA